MHYGRSPQLPRLRSQVHSARPAGSLTAGRPLRSTTAEVGDVTSILFGPEVMRKSHGLCATLFESFSDSYSSRCKDISFEEGSFWQFHIRAGIQQGCMTSGAV